MDPRLRGDDITGTGLSEAQYAWEGSEFRAGGTVKGLEGGTRALFFVQAV